jgi:hypothetical protein
MAIPKPAAQLEAAAKAVSLTDRADNVFWSIVLKEDRFSDIRIKLLPFYDLVYNLGFRRFDTNGQSVFVQIIQGRILKLVTVTDIQDTVYSWIDQLPVIIDTEHQVHRDFIKEKIHKGVSTFFSTQRLTILKPKQPIDFNSDDFNTKYMYFNNGFLQITAARTAFLTYDKLNGYIWENQLLRRDYDPNQKPAPGKNYVEQFFQLVSGGNKRFTDLQNIAGYLMHQYNDYALKGIVLTDSKVSEGSDEGRTGKTLFCRLVGQAISHDIKDVGITTYVEINGKDFDPNNKHKYADCNLDTSFILINDLKKYLKIDIFFNDVTEGQTVDGKGQKSFRILAKMALTTNSTLDIKGGSGKDRFLEYEFTSHFSHFHRPENEFGHWFFRDWKAADWNNFYTFMAECCRVFLAAKCKLREPDQINLNRRKLLEQTSPEFIDWIENDLRPYHNSKYPYGQLYDRFTGAYPDFRSDKFKQRKFKEWLKTLCNYHPEFADYNKELNESRDADNRYFHFIRI